MGSHLLNLLSERRDHGMSCELQHSGVPERFSQHQRISSCLAPCERLLHLI